MKARRLLAAGLGCTATTAVLLACTLTQSLDYLQSGSVPADVVSEMPTAEGGAEGGRPQPTVLVPNQLKPRFLAQDDATLYWIAGGNVMSVPKSGGAPKSLGGVPLTASSLVAELDPAGAVFVTVGTNVLRLPKDGTDGGVVFAPDAAEPPADTIAASASALYVLQYDQTFAIDGSRILRMAKDGGGATDIAPDSGPVTLNLDSRSVFWLRPAPPEISEQVENAAPGTTTASYSLNVDDDEPNTSAELAIDDASFYWLTTDSVSNTAKVVSRKRDTTASVVALYRGGVDDIFSFVRIDATHVYFIETRTGSLLRVPKGSGDVERLVVGLKAPTGLVVDSNAIYVTVEATGSTGQVLALVK